MPQIDSSLVDSIANLDPVRLAILFIGLICFGVIWLAYLVVKYMGNKR